MSLIKSLKAQAENLMVGLAEEGITVSKGKALDLVARQYGFANWDTLCAAVLRFEEGVQAPTLADLEFRPSTAFVEQGVHTAGYHVDVYEEEGLALINDEPGLRAFLAKYPDLFERGLDSTALFLLGDGHDIELSFREMLGVKHTVVNGKSVWALADGKRFIGFDTEPVVATQFELTIPKVTRSIKGTKLIALRSGDGSFYDHFAMVPPHLDVEKIRTKISEELTALKDRDAANPDSDDEYTEKDVRAIIERLGCLWVASPHEVGQNWDA